MKLICVLTVAAVTAAILSGCSAPLAIPVHIGLQGNYGTYSYSAKDGFSANFRIISEK